MKEKPQPLPFGTSPTDLLNELYNAILEALKAGDRPGTHIQKTDTLKFAASRLYAALRRSARFLGKIPPPRFMRYR